MPDQQQPLALSIDPIHASSFSVNVPFLVNTVDVNQVIRDLQRTVEELQGQVRQLQERLGNL